MEPYLYGVREDIHIFDLEQTVCGSMSNRYKLRVGLVSTMAAVQSAGLGTSPQSRATAYVLWR